MKPTVIMRALAATAVATALAAEPARAMGFGAGVGASRPILLRLRGFVGSAPQGVATLRPFTLGIDSTVITLDLADVQTLTGPLTAGRAALHQFDLFNPNLLLVGERALLQHIRGTPPHTQITIFGYVRQGARRLLVVRVEAA